MTYDSRFTAHDSKDTIVALSTPAGSGAIAVIRLSGKEAVEICNKVFKSKDLTQQPTHTLHYGNIADGERVIDEVVVSLFLEPNSYTRENVVEVSCHGSLFIIREIIQLFIRNGARSAQPGEFTLRAFLNGRFDLSQAEAVADLIASSSRASHQVAMQQLRGGFSNQLKNLRQQLVDFAALIELELDFSEEDVEFANRAQLKTLIHQINAVLQQLIQSFELGNAIKNGVNTVIAGRPNAGKSTLLNALLNEERAIVSDIAGTTRDTIEEVLNIRGIDFRLIDTAGIREAQGQIEEIGIRKTMEKIQQSSILLYLFDANDLTNDDIRADLKQLSQPDLKLLAVANKMDIANVDRWRKRDLHSLLQKEFGCELIELSAKEQSNIEPLKEVVYHLFARDDMGTESTIISNLRHVEALNKTYEALQQALAMLDKPVSGELVAFELKQALYYLGLITGEVSTDDLLSSIFSRFCIGK